MHATDDTRGSGTWTFDDLASDPPEEGTARLDLTDGEVAALRDVLDYIAQRITDGTARASALSLIDFQSVREKLRTLEAL